MGRVRAVARAGNASGPSLRPRHVDSGGAFGRIRFVEQALDRMVTEARDLDADAILAVRFQTSMVMSGAAELLAYGTAVKLEEE